MGTTNKSHQLIQNFCSKYKASHPEYDVLTCNCQHFIQELHAWLGCQNKLPLDQVSDISLTAGIVAAEAGAAKAFGDDAASKYAAVGAMIGAAVLGTKGARIGGAIGGAIGVAAHHLKKKNPDEEEALSDDRSRARSRTPLPCRRLSE
jgi:hypothetical protein